jgi:uncharacterized protein (TIGR02118 family)
MVQVLVLHGEPADPEAFERHYAGTHVPLAARMPGVRRFETGRPVGTHDGGPPPYFRIAELWFDSEEALRAAMATPEGQATAADLDNFATGGVTVMIVPLDAGPGGGRPAS